MTLTPDANATHTPDTKVQPQSVRRASRPAALPRAPLQAVPTDSELHPNPARTALLARHSSSLSTSRRTGDTRSTGSMMRMSRDGVISTLGPLPLPITNPNTVIYSQHLRRQCENREIAQNGGVQVLQ